MKRLIKKAENIFAYDLIVELQIGENENPEATNNTIAISQFKPTLENSNYKKELNNLIDKFGDYLDNEGLQSVYDLGYINFVTSSLEDDDIWFEIVATKELDNSEISNVESRLMNICSKYFLTDNSNSLNYQFEEYGEITTIENDNEWEEEVTIFYTIKAVSKGIQKGF